MTLIAIAGLVWRHRRIAAVLTALAIFQVVPLLRYSGSNPVLPEPASSARLRILMANVLAHNSDHERLAELIRRERPDVVGLVEVTHAWLHDLADVRAEYPYRYEAPGGTQGLALWFRERPLADAEVEPLVAGGWPVLHAIIEFGGLPRHLWLVHPASPLRHQRRRPGNSELVALGERVQQTGGSRVVIGDLNSTDGSPHFSDFLDTSGLRDTRLGFGRQPSWPVWSPYRITIDHAFLSPDLAVASRRLGPDIGSDHRPLILDVALAAGAVSATKAATQASQSSP
jgi:endonuclease/exonuclease/phosphatase (EEP) superfamily protein YafD